MGWSLGSIFVGSGELSTDWHRFALIEEKPQRTQKFTENTEIFPLCSLRLCVSLRLCINLGVLCALGALGVNLFVLSVSLFPLRLCVNLGALGGSKSK